jgi:hypothetical protein
MKPIEPGTAGAAAVFFAELLLPLRRAQMRRGSAYLDRGPPRASYWAPIASRTGGIESLTGSQCNFAGALTLLEQYWQEHQERDLLQLVAHLERLQAQLQASPSTQDTAGAVPEFVYPLF